MNISENPYNRHKSSREEGIRACNGPDAPHSQDCNTHEESMEPESLCLHGGYTPGNGEPRVLPIAQSTTFTYESTAAVARLFDLQDEGFFYTRLANPTIDAVERKIAELEGGVGALCTASGQAANLLAILNVARSGDHIISTASIYGGTFNLFAVTLKKMGIEVTFVDQTAPDAEIEKAIRPETRAIFGETLTNPSLDVLDIERMAALAHRHGLPLIVDNTFATPILCRPFDFGADIVVHSTTKYMDGHAVQMGGVIVDSGRFDWTQGRFPEFTEPDASYHGLIYTQTFGKAAYIVKARVQLMRDLGCCQTPQGAFYLFPKCDSFFGKKDGDRVINNADDLAMYLLEVGHVACVGGTSFGAPECIRMSYATSDENIVESMRRIKETLARLK